MPERAELEVLDQVFLVRGRLPLEVEVLVPMHEKDLHEAIRSISRSYVSPYFSAIAQA